MRRALMVATLFLAMPALADTKPPAKMEEPMAGKMKKPGMKQGDVKKKAEAKKKEMKPKLEKESREMQGGKR